MMGQHGGAAFILLYIGFVLLLGIPGMVAEFIVGREGGANAVRSYFKLGKRTPFALAGIIGLFASICILGFYSVISGWCLYFFYASMTGKLHGDTEQIKNVFDNFSTSAVTPAILSVVFIILTNLIVSRGIKEGIEKLSKILMPLLFIFLIAISIAACSLPNAMEGIKFLFHPDFSKVDGAVVLGALGQAFFSLSLGAACLCTYASYFDKSINLLKSATEIALIDTLVAIFAGLMIFPTAFSVGISPDSGPSLVFITLPNAFNLAFSSVPVLGDIISMMFYILLALAAITSTISLHEMATAVFHEELHLSRKVAAAVVTTICSVIAVLCSLSLGAEHINVGGKDLLDALDFFTGQILLPIVSMLTCLMVGWYLPKKMVKDEYTNWGATGARLYGVFLFIIRFVCPILILIILFN